MLRLVLVLAFWVVDWLDPGSARKSSLIGQQRYDNSYMQCMYAKGHRVPVSGKITGNSPGIGGNNRSIYNPLSVYTTSPLPLGNPPPAQIE